ncbi:MULTISPECIES: gp53-like domain-containing protein [Yersinia pseudotuberculosis complex]|uniref:gp53-like domain-containing protein n=1 Tax=Yersinia pseudotuberculosis complex TaxID=1649845 RepID=UPI00061C86EB|nr:MULTISPECIES: hypothetical protein [Yersinia pseudotuberculosis complex]MBO1551459.1 hypothetical protein [Yersinia pseudotuberculosis]MBO1571669.1 hypothetical protein [Yersinia pseudotuberculosis]MBO1586572.1 hypothetical protein [Yersinia pseudotuberculosis]MBO1636164.1 hypothetical protein [Yersinia pseudotuberculosis]CNB99895.1 bacteriophage tail fiber protein [Yersinia similis]
MYGLDNNSGISVMPPVAPAVSPAPLWFTDGGAGQSPSYPGQDWFNMFQAEHLNVLAEADITPDKGDLTQLSKAIKKIMSSGSLLIKNNLSEIKSTGPAAIAQTLANLGLKGAAKRDVGIEIDQIPDMSYFNCNFASPGWQRLPSKMIIQWGRITTGDTDIITQLPITFPTNFLHLSTSTGYTANSGTIGYICGEIYNNSSIVTRSPHLLGGTYLAIGY